MEQHQSIRASDGASYATVLALIAEWKRKDIDAVLARVTDDVAWHTHVGSPVVHGKAAMRSFLETMAAGISDNRWRIHHHAVSGNRIFLEGVDDFVLVKEQRRVAIPYLGTMVFRGGLISEWRDYFDRGLFNRLKAGEAAPPEIAALAAKPGDP
jgi:limonene-1,2-epoxide hydrolase